MSESYNQARDLLEEQKFSEALDLLREVEPLTAMVKTSVARCMAGLGKWEQAHSLFCEVLSEDPQNHEALAGRGMLYFFTGHFEKALADYDRAVEGQPMNGRYHGLRGVLKAQLGDMPGALKDLESAYDLGAHDPSYLMARAQIHLTSNQKEEAEKMIALCEQHGGDEGAIAALEGALNMMKGDPKEALASYRFAVEKAPEAVNNWMNMLTLTAQLDRPRLLDEALRALDAHPDSGEVIQVAVGACREAGKTKEAFQLLKDAIERNPKNPLLYFQLGLGLAHAGKFEKAAEQFTKALEHAPRFPRALDARGNCLEQLGRKEEAQADFEKSHEIRQEDAEKQAAARKRAAAAQSSSAG